jgi:hypothetical protein
MKQLLPTPRKPFRAFCSNMYYQNRDEYDSCGQTQPHTFEQYLKENISLLKEKYRLTFRKKDRIV